MLREDPIWVLVRFGGNDDNDADNRSAHVPRGKCLRRRGTCSTDTHRAVD